MSDRIKVMTIVGCGRSGSTILGNTLGQIPGYLHVGELCYIWNWGIVKDALCGCGQPFHACEFWRAVLARSGRSLDKDDAARLAAFPRHANRRMALTMLRGRGPMELAKGIGEYLDALRDLYRALKEETGCRVVIDSSKAPSHSYLLRAAQDVDLYVLHLVRDPRAVAYSWARQMVRRDYDPKNPIAMVRFSTLRSAVKWTYANATAELLRKDMGGKILTMRYEDFLANPRRTLSQITGLVDETTDVLPFTSERELHLEATHTVWGNPSRLRTGPVELRLDAEWQEKMGVGRRALVTSVAWPLLRKYDYHAARGAPRAGAGTPLAAPR